MCIYGSFQTVQLREEVRRRHNAAAERDALVRCRAARGGITSRTGSPQTAQLREHVRRAASSSAERDSLLADLAVYNAFEHGIEIAHERVTPDFTSPGLRAAAAAADPAAALRAAGVVVLGSGAYGVVAAGEFTFHHLVGGRQLTVRKACAVKTLWHEIASEFNRRAFDREVAISAGLAHRNIVRTFGTIPGPPRCLIMEALLASLGDVLVPAAGHPPVGALTLRESIDVCAGVAAGVAFLHDQKIVHGDLRPGNVLLDGLLVAKVSDLGTARQMAAMGQGTAAGPVLGHYCAPERRAMGAAADAVARVMANPRAWDAYSLSVLFLEVLTGERADEARWAVLRDRVAHPPLRACLMEAHDPNPTLRPAVETLVVALRGAAGTRAYMDCAPSRRLARNAAGHLHLA